MSKKILYLFLALLLPGLIFVFLKYFGKNEFDIPVYYQDGVKESDNDCRITTSDQYLIPDSVLTKWNWSQSSTLVTFTAEKENKELQQRLSEEKIGDLTVIRLTDADIKIKQCVLFMKEPWDAVLIDAQKRIRGYYKLGHRDDMDRLDVELKILLKKY